MQVRDLEDTKNSYRSMSDLRIIDGENKDYAYWLVDTGENPDRRMQRFPEGGSKVRKTSGSREAYLSPPHWNLTRDRW